MSSTEEENIIIQEEPTTDNVENTDIESSNDKNSELFTSANLSLFILFLAVYFITYFVLGLFIKGENQEGFATKFSRIIDMILTLFVIGIILFFYFGIEDSQKNEYLTQRGDELKQYIEDDFSILYQVGFIFIFYLVIYLFRIPMKMGQKPGLIFITESIAWLLLLLIIVVKFFQVIFDINILDDFSQLFGIKKEVVQPTVIDKREVFNISNNKYTYEEAQAICKAYGAELATYDQIENAYNKGAEWCNYGWSANQMAFFPTQKQTWEKLQVSEKHKNNCGRPGVNGGFMANPNLKFGINCFGEKPSPTDLDKARLSNSGPSIPPTQEESTMDKKINYWKENKDKFLQINSHNYNKWSKHE